MQAAVGMRDFDLALQRLDEAIDQNTNFANMLAVEPFFDPLRNQPGTPSYSGTRAKRARY
jgi:hypothetical protein